MSIRLIAAAAARRDAAVIEAASSSEPVSEATSGVGGPATPAGGIADAAARLEEAVPTEVVAAYTALQGVIASVLTDSPTDRYVELRWALLLAFAIGTAGAVTASFRSAATRRRVPVLEAGVATAAFVIWALVIPESPLFEVLSGTGLVLTMGVISIAGAFVITNILAPLVAPLDAT